MDLAALAVGFALGALLVGFAAWRVAQARADALRAERAALEARLEAERTVAVDRERAFADARERLREAFAAAAAGALKDNNAAFLALAAPQLELVRTEVDADLVHRQQAIESLLAPVRDTLGQLDAKLVELDRDRADDRGELREQLAGIQRVNELLRTETSRLGKAFSEPGTRGRWGELQLHRVVELAGMAEHCDFDEQVTADSEAGGRPDLVVRLPGDRQIVVDAKAPLEAFLRAAEAPDEARREEQLEEYARSVRAHMTRLGAKNYWAQFPGAVELVVMFLPGEAFFAAALGRDPSLAEYGVERRVVLASPLNLIALLKALASGWRDAKASEGARLIVQAGRELHERLATFTEHLKGVGDHLARADKAYQLAVRSYRNRLLPQVRRLEDHGASGSKTVPELASTDSALEEPQLLPAAEDSETTPEPPSAARQD